MIEKNKKKKKKKTPSIKMIFFNLWVAPFVLNKPYAPNENALEEPGQF